MNLTIAGQETFSSGGWNASSTRPVVHASGCGSTRGSRLLLPDPTCARKDAQLSRDRFSTRSRLTNPRLQRRRERPAEPAAAALPPYIR